MTIIDRAELIVNWLTDRNWLWWPLLFLRPRQSDHFSFRLAFGLSLLVTVIAHAFVIALRLTMQKPVPVVLAILLTIVILAMAFAWYCAVAFFWNRRALRLQNHA